MIVENLPSIGAVEEGFVVDPTIPVIPFALTVERSGCARSHAHPRGQLIFASSGVMKVIAEKSQWIVPPSQGVWVPPFVEHQVFFPGNVELRNLFVDESACRDLSQRCVVIEVSAFLREFVLRVFRWGKVTTSDPKGLRFVQVLLDEIAQAPQSPWQLPLGRDERLVRVVQTLLQNPGDRREFETLAIDHGASARTLARLFVHETGMTYGQWRKKLTLQESVARLDHGESVTRVAFDLGYESLSAFVQMFRKSLGVSPGHFMRVE